MCILLLGAYVPASTHFMVKYGSPYLWSPKLENPTHPDNKKLLRLSGCVRSLLFFASTHFLSSYHVCSQHFNDVSVLPIPQHGRPSSKSTFLRPPNATQDRQRSEHAAAGKIRAIPVLFAELAQGKKTHPSQVRAGTRSKARRKFHTHLNARIIC
jgi:hypothetical protein